MALFNFIETIFFISLGISFVLILLLVYHFKQRLNTLEQKGDTMFEIINNIVKELNNIKNNVLNVQSPFFSNYTPTIIRTVDHSLQKHSVEELDKDDNDANDDNDNIEDDDDDDEDDDTDSETDDITEAEDDDIEYKNNEDKDEMLITYTSEDVECELEKCFYDKNKIVVSDNENDEENTTNVKVINVGITELAEPVIEIQPEIIQDVIINKIDDDSTTNNIIESSKLSKIEEYKKLSTVALKGLVISKGLCSDASKMKKNELLKLLEIELDDD